VQRKTLQILEGGVRRPSPSLCRHEHLCLAASFGRQGTITVRTSGRSWYKLSDFGALRGLEK